MNGSHSTNRALAFTEETNTQKHQITTTACSHAPRDNARVNKLSAQTRRTTRPRPRRNHSSIHKKQPLSCLLPNEVQSHLPQQPPAYERHSTPNSQQRHLPQHMRVSRNQAPTSRNWVICLSAPHSSPRKANSETPRFRASLRAFASAASKARTCTAALQPSQLCSM